MKIYSRFLLSFHSAIRWYVGHEEGGQLTEAVRRRPYSVVLFDEVEKAHMSVFNTLLQVLDEGRLTDGQGRTVDFRNTLIIMTSNFGAEHLLSGLIGQGINANCTWSCNAEGTELLHYLTNKCTYFCFVEIGSNLFVVTRQVRKHFRPELLNRLDGIVVFDPLSHEQLRKVTQLQMKDITSRLAERRIALDVRDAALDYVLEKSYDPVKHLPFPLSSMEFYYLTGTFHLGDHKHCFRHGKAYSLLLPVVFWSIFLYMYVQA